MTRETLALPVEQAEITRNLGNSCCRTTNNTTPGDIFIRTLQPQCAAAGIHILAGHSNRWISLFVFAEIQRQTSSRTRFAGRASLYLPRSRLRSNHSNKCPHRSRPSARVIRSPRDSRWDEGCRCRPSCGTVTFAHVIWTVAPHARIDAPFIWNIDHDADTVASPAPGRRNRCACPDRCWFSGRTSVACLV